MPCHRCRAQHQPQCFLNLSSSLSLENKRRAHVAPRLLLDLRAHEAVAVVRSKCHQPSTSWGEKDPDTTTTTTTRDSTRTAKKKTANSLPWPLAAMIACWHAQNHRVSTPVVGLVPLAVLHKNRCWSFLRKVSEKSAPSICEAAPAGAATRNKLKTSHAARRTPIRRRGARDQRWQPPLSPPRSLQHRARSAVRPSRESHSKRACWAGLRLLQRGPRLCALALSGLGGAATDKWAPMQPRSE